MSAFSASSFAAEAANAMLRFWDATHGGDDDAARRRLFRGPLTFLALGC